MKQTIKNIIYKIKKSLMKQDWKLIGVIVGCMAGAIGLFYVFGLFAQFIDYAWVMRYAVMSPEKYDIPKVSYAFFDCIAATFSSTGFKGIIAILVIGLIVALLNIDRIEKWRRNRKNGRGFERSESNSHGSANELSFSDIKERFEVSTADESRGIILGEIRDKLVCLPRDKKGNRNIAVVGSSGTGKSRAVIRNALFQMMINGESVVLTDPKGELYADAAYLFAVYGYEIKVLNLVDIERSDGWNPMEDVVKQPEKATVLAKSLIINTSTSNGGDKFWDDVAENLLKGLILWVALDENLTSAEKNLAEVYRLITMESENEFCLLLGRLSDKHPAKQAFNTYLMSTESVRMSTRAGLATRLGILQEKRVKDFFSSADINLCTPAERKCVYYVVTSDNDMSKNMITALFFTCLMQSVLAYADKQPDKKCAVPVNFVLDEFNNVGKLGISADGSDFARFVSTCRSRAINVTFAVQGIGQLQNRYGNCLWSDILNNCDTQILLGCNDLITAEYFSARSGEITVEYDTYAKSERTGSRENTYTYSKQKTKRRLFTPDEILRGNPSKLKCFCDGLGVMTLDKFDYSRHSLYKYIVKEDVNGYVPKRVNNPVETPEKDEKQPESKTEKGFYKIRTIDAKTDV